MNFNLGDPYNLPGYGNQRSGFGGQDGWGGYGQMNPYLLRMIMGQNRPNPYGQSPYGQRDDDVRPYGYQANYPGKRPPFGYNQPLTPPTEPVGGGRPDYGMYPPGGFGQPENYTPPGPPEGGRFRFFPPPATQTAQFGQPENYTPPALKPQNEGWGQSPISGIQSPTQPRGGRSFMPAFQMPTTNQMNQPNQNQWTGGYNPMRRY